MSNTSMKVIKDGKNIITIQKSNKTNKKYKAVISYPDGAISTVYFGGINMTTGEPYEQYKDATGLGLYTKYNHLDKVRRDNYYKRHGPYKNMNKYSPAYFSAKYLWPLD